MNNEWKMVPVELLERILGCISYGEADELKALLAEPMPPAGDVEVLASLGLTLAVLHEVFNAPDSAERLGNMDVPRVMRGAFGDFERIKTHVTRLTADRDSECKLRKDLAVRVHELSDENKDLKGERDGLLAEVGRLKDEKVEAIRLKSVEWLRANTLKSELTEALAEVKRFQSATSLMADELNHANIRAIAAEEMLAAGPSYADGTHPNQYEAELEVEAEEAREQLDLIGSLIPEEYEPYGSELDCLTAYLADMQSELTKARELLSHMQAYSNKYPTSPIGEYKNQIAEVLAHQSAPAAKGGSDE